MLAAVLALLSLILAGAACARGGWWWAGALGGALAALAASPSFFIVTKAASRLAMPPGLLWAAQLVALGVGLRLGARWVPWLAGFLVLYSVAGNVWLGSALLRALEAPFAAKATPTEPLDALWVLGGATTLGPNGEPRVGTAGDRVVTAARLYHTGRARLLLASGTSVAGIQQAERRDLGAETLAIWTELGVPGPAMQALDGPRNTLEEMQALQRWQAEHPHLRLGVLSSAWHLRRVMRHAERLGVRVVPVPADFRGERPAFGLVGLIPSSAGFDRVRVAAREWLGAAVGR